MTRAQTRIATAAVCILGLGSSIVMPTAAQASNAAVNGRSMWIWYMSHSDGGNVSAIVSRARSAGVKTLIIKGADGGHYWSQFSPQMVGALRGAGLHVCAWQYVYGTDPIGEAEMGARTVRSGAECLVIDAEAEYEGRYSSAASYLQRLRALVGRNYPVGLATFPYVDYHPSFPYSVFLGPGGAQFDMPQMYWRDIGSSVAAVYHHTYTFNRIYRRPIYPLGQTYGTPSGSDIQQFRGSAVRYRAPGISWWDYAWTSAAGLWSPVSGLYAQVSAPPLGEPVLGVGSKGDAVLWMQEHLAREFPSQRTTGLFASQTLGNLRTFQARHRMPVTGSTDTATWISLLRLSPVATAWSAAASVASASHGAAASPGSGTGGALAPASASVPALAYEIPELGAALASPDVSRAEP